MSDDVIRRSDAIKATWQEPTYTDPLNVLTEVRDRIEAIPSADRPQGEWIYVTVEEWLRTGREYGHHCSECDEINKSGKSNFCPDCGADMRRGTDNG